MEMVYGGGQENSVGCLTKHQEHDYDDGVPLDSTPYKGVRQSGVEYSELVSVESTLYKID
jgi:hypothetical protein